MGASDLLEVRLLDGVERVDAGAWDACVAGGNPFVRHGFLAALEESGSASGAAGWLPRHLELRGPGGEVLGVAPAYVKGHSFGEYVFDWEWAEACERAGGRYYPKLQVAVPFTPVPGPRLGVPPGPHREARQRALAAGLVETARRLDLSSVHVTFCPEEEARLLEGCGFLVRTGLQFHWENRGYATFDDFLADLASRKRKAIRRERREVQEAGLRFQVLEGAEVGEREWDLMYRFYMDTGSRKWGSPYLNRRFFSLLGRNLPESVVLVLAWSGSECVAGALNLQGGDALYGRYWGCRDPRPFLHFETCYYQAVEYAIRRGLRRVEAGAQGPHKLQRGYRPVRTWSAHWLADGALRRAVERALAAERRWIDRQVAEAPSPFRK